MNVMTIWPRFAISVAIQGVRIPTPAAQHVGPLREYVSW